MPEAFPAFGNSYRSLFASMLAISSSGIAAFLLMATKTTALSNCFKYAYFIGLTSFVITALILIASIYIGLKHEVLEGERTGLLQSREINKKKFIIIRSALIPFILGVFCLLASGYSIVFYGLIGD